MRRILVFLEILIPLWAISGDVFLAENVRKAKLENQKLAELIRQKLNENDIQQLLKNLTIEETEKIYSENEVSRLLSHSNGRTKRSASLHFSD